jgi:ribonucleotide reductase beta subunit family protein with ferritin-like domain
LIGSPLDQNDISTIITEAVDIECEFVAGSINASMIGMNIELMQQYVKYVADRLVTQLGYAKLYNVQNPFDFMNRIALNNKTNFFEGRVADYGRARVGQEKKDNTFALDADF